LGPTKLSKAILYATITNIATYLPFLLLKGDVGRYIYSLPVTIACSLVASRLISMTFIPLLSYYLLRATPEPDIHERRTKGFGKWYSRAVTFAIDHRWKALAASSILLLFGAYFAKSLRHQFFPRDDFYIAYVDVRLPQDAPLEATERAAKEAETAIEEVAANYDHGGASVLASITSFVGAGGPRFWFSVPPEPPSRNYPPLLLPFTPTETTNSPVPPLHEAGSSPGTG